MELADRNCERVEPGTAPMSEERASSLAEQMPNWDVGEGTLNRDLEFADFNAAMEFANAVARLAAEQDHHPRICVDYDTVELTLTTHKIGGLSMNDFIMAAKIDRLPT